MRRRAFLVGGAAIVAAATGVRAQPRARTARVGLLPVGSSESEVKSLRATFLAGLGELGWREGGNLVIEERWAKTAEEAPARAAELARLRPDVVFTVGPQASQAMAQATREIPIVFVGVANPVAMNLVSSLSHPGGNVTGFTTAVSEGYPGKLVELLREIAPGAAKIAVLTVAGNVMHDGFFRVAQEQAPRGATLVALAVRDRKGIEAAFETATREAVQGIIAPGDPLVSSHRELVVGLALRHRLPSVFMFSNFAEAGGLLSYGVSLAGLYRSAARPVDRILRGARPAELPVERPTQYELVLNLKTARELGLALPPSLLVRADRVIE